VEQVRPKDVRAAREFLRKRGIRGVSPRQFARSAQETGITYQALLESLAGVARRKLDGNNAKTVSE
jgi:DNA-binding transcriptional regulator YbjK